MRDRLDEIGDDTVVALVTFTGGPLDWYEERHRIPFPILVDRDRATYRAYGLERGSFRRVWGWATIEEYAKILRRDGVREVAKASEDTRQLGGDFVIAPDGTLAWGYWSRGPADRPSVDDILAAVRST